MENNENFGQHSQNPPVVVGTPSSIQNYGGMISSEDPPMILSFTEIFLIVKRRKYLIISVMCAFLLFAHFFLKSQTTLYTASALLQVEASQDNIIDDIKSVVGSSFGKDAAIDTELDVMASKAVISKVIDKLGLINDPEFNKQLRPKSITEALKIEFKDRLGWFNEDSAEKPAATATSKAATRNLVLGNILSRLGIERKKKTYTIEVSFTSESPPKAMKIANSIIEEYLNHKLNKRFEDTDSANSWLSERLQVLKKKLQISERAVQQFKEKYGLDETGENSLSGKQLSQVNSQLVMARAERAAAEARYDNAKKSPDSSPEVLKANIIQSLLSQETQIRRKKSEMSSRYGPKHPKMVHVESELKEIREKIKESIERVLSSLNSEVEIARTRELALESNLNEVQGSTKIGERAEVELAELSRQMETDKMLYESFLKRFKETSSENDMGGAQMRVISWADVPIGPSYPHNKIVYSIAASLGFVIAVFFIMVVESLDNTFRGTSQVEESLGLKVLGMVPKLGKTSKTAKYMFDVRPSTVFFESLRSIFTMLEFIFSEKKYKTIMVTSSTPSEGKSFFSSSYAAMLAKSGSKVLLVDCDLKRSSISQYVSKGKKVATLNDFITGKATENQIIMSTEIPSLHFVPSRANTAYSQNYLNAARMDYFIEVMSARYDYIIFDTPPVLAVSDSLVLARKLDTVIFAVHWGKTPKKMVTQAVKQILPVAKHFSGLILTVVDLKKHKLYDYGDSGSYYGKYKSYYGDNA
jgi:capsular exopolysaccharide synthesis family protein